MPLLYGVRALAAALPTPICYLDLNQAVFAIPARGVRGQPGAPATATAWVGTANPARRSGAPRWQTANPLLCLDFTSTLPTGQRVSGPPTPAPQPPSSSRV